jgi:hypothetical protein
MRPLFIVNDSLPLRLLDDGIQNDLPVPYCSLSDHTLPVTDIIIGVGLFPACRTLTSSLDHSVKVCSPVLFTLSYHLTSPDRRSGISRRSPSWLLSSSLMLLALWPGTSPNVRSLQPPLHPSQMDQYTKSTCSVNETTNWLHLQLKQ